MNLVEFKILKCTGGELWWYHDIVGKYITIDLDNNTSFNNIIHYKKTGIEKYDCLCFDIIDDFYLKIYHKHNGVEYNSENTMSIILLDDINYFNIIRKKKLININE